MRKALVFMIILAMVPAVFGCVPAAPEAPIDVSATPAIAEFTPVPEAQPVGIGYVMREETLYFPEASSEADAQYRLTYSMPFFGTESMNAAVDMYLDELYTRVTTERLPLADRAEGEALPETTVTCSVLPCDMPDGAYTNVIFEESASFGGEAEHSVHTIVLTPAGSAASLAAVSGVYFPSALVAQQVWNIIATDPSAYFGDITLDSIASNLDLYNGFTVADEGYTVYLPVGTVADESMGTPEFSFARSALYPGFVGDVITVEDYETVMPLLNAQADAAARESFGLAPAAADADGASAEIFRMLSEDAYATDTGIVIAGSLMSGAPDDPEAAAMATVTAELTKASGAWTITSFDVM